MKKLISAILIACLCISLCACAGSNTTNDVESVEITNKPTEALSDKFQYPAKNDEWEYDVYERHIVLSRYIGKNRDVIVPDTIDGLPVTELEESVILGEDGCFSGLSIGKVTLGRNITFVGGFAGSTIHTLEFADDNLIEFEDDAFFACDNIQNVDEIIAHVSGEVFPCIFASSRSKALHTIKIPDRFTKIKSGAFRGCSELRYIDIGNVSEVEEQAFAEVPLLGLTVHNKECKIEEDAFAHHYPKREDYYFVYTDEVKRFTKDLVIYAPAGSTAAKLASELSLGFTLIEG